MDSELRKLIEAYCSKVAELIPRLSEALGFKLPITNTDWVSFNIPQRGQIGDGLQYFKHGYGVAIKYDGGELDMDFGDNGEHDGFDAGRLSHFAEKSNIQTSYKDFREVEAALKAAESQGQIRYSGYILYYLNDKE